MRGVLSTVLWVPRPVPPFTRTPRPLSSESYDEFKMNIHNLFPVIIDTKNVTKDVWKVRGAGFTWHPTLGPRLWARSTPEHRWVWCGLVPLYSPVSVSVTPPGTQLPASFKPF